MANLEVVGRHALFFDDDASAEFVNSSDALVQWNSLSIDRYDVRHLLSSPPPPRNHRRHLTSSISDPAIQSELDRERYLDLPSQDELQQREDAAEDSSCPGGFRAVPFSYGSTDASSDLKNTEVETVFCPPFPVPDSLKKHLPPTEKLHQIIARTALFVSIHGGQSEIILRVKQGDNPTFGFLMPDHNLHQYFRFLVEHQELLKSDTSDRSQGEVNRGESGALSLLGSVYGSGEDEDGVADVGPPQKANESVEKKLLDENEAEQSGEMESEINVKEKDKAGSKNSLSSLKEKITVIKRNRGIGNVQTGTISGTKKDDKGTIAVAGDKSQDSALQSTSKVELPILEPPSEIKRVIDKIVEFILRNGKEFEAVLIEQDRKHGRFPFLLPSNYFHPYYLKVLQNAQESKLVGKGSSESQESLGHGVEKKRSKRTAETLSYSDHDVPFEIDKKEKFKMVLGKSKKNEQEPQATTSQVEVNVDATAAAAILQAATRGIKYPSIGFLSKSSMEHISQGTGSDGKQVSSSGSLPFSQPQGFPGTLEQNCEHGVAKAMAKAAALAAAAEADSSEACLDREQKVKAERLKRAKMFAALIKSRAAPLQSEPRRGPSVEPSGSGISGTDTEVAHFSGKEREGSSVPVDTFTSDKNAKSDKTNTGDEYAERLAKRKYRVKSKTNDKEDNDDENYDSTGEGEENEVEKEDRDHKYSKKSRTRSSHHSRDRDKHRKKYSSSRDKDSRHERKQKYSDSKHHHSRHLDKNKSSTDDEYERSHRQHKDSSSSDEEHRHSGRHRKRNSSSDEDVEGYQSFRKHSKHRHKLSSDKEQQWEHRRVKPKKSHSQRSLDLEEGEISTKSDQSTAGEGGLASREASVNVSNSERTPSQPSEVNEASDDFRAKIRAMLLATL